MRALISSIVLAGSLAIGGAAMAQPLVDSGWMKSNLEKPGMVVLDVTGRTQAQYASGHLPGSVFTDYAKDGWRVNIDGAAGKLPPAANLEKLIGSLGIDNATHVVRVPLGDKAVDMGAATRIYWTFKVAGHDKVSILDGGYTEWSRIDPKTKMPANQLATGGVQPQPKPFKVSIRQEMLVSTADVQKAIENNVPLVDNRPNDFYVGLSVSPAATRSGTIPGAKNTWSQTSSATVELKALISSAMASAGVFQPRVFLGRPFINLATSFSQVCEASLRSVPLGMN